MTPRDIRSHSQVLLMVPTAVGVGLTSASLGLMQALDTIGLKTGFLKPFRQDELNGPGPDRSTALVSSTLGLRPPAPIAQGDLERLLRQDRLDVLMEQVIELYDQAVGDDPASMPDLIVVEGVVPTAHGTYATQLNAQLAHALNARIVLVGSGDAAAPGALAEQLDMHAQAFGGVGSTRTLGCILMRMQNLPGAEEPALAPGTSSVLLDDDFLAEFRRHSPALATDRFHLIGVVPYNPALTAPRVLDVARALDARFLNEGDAANRRVLSTSLCARSAANALHVFRPGSLIVTSGDRDDIVLASALATMNGVPMAGVLLTNGFMPNDNMIEMCRPALKTGMPVLAVDTDSFTTAKNLGRMSNDIPMDDLERAEQVTRFVAGHLDLQWLKDHLSRGFARRLSPSAFRHQLVKLAQRANRRIILPEGNEPRTVEAAAICQRRGIANCVLLARREEVEEVARNRGIELPEGLEILDPEQIRSRYVAPMVERRRGKVNELTAEDQLQDNVVLGTMMLQLDEVDGLVSGAIHTTANTVRPAFQLIKTAPGYRQVSSIFFMLLPEQVVVYGDCAVNPDPDAEALAEIAIQSARSAQAFGIEPRVAMISYSTGESGSGADVDKVRQATRLARELAPDLLIDGPLQYDAAAIESVGRQKAPDSPVAGRATVFVFPDLNTGNTTYKAVQRSARVVSVGPMLQGLNKPVNDLSRGALVDDIVYTIALTAIQAAQRG
ncbi:MAG: phosphate acetyltransferase [Halomonas sp.]|jgi:phosphate acetyltransferase|uniref:Phosphate acetyltransferase n=1 Tax=Billgrantia tianxiuensis TaxID=2497861 RepID=A0A6I6SJB6_9GAMM|nr:MULTISPECIES: phosphate acetyltransferase [Halomonas]MCE8032652.1 phosphate acetyltransferase [Halomonas sp. MCCC 1A11057]MDX5434961.1 phosphate acetyltransferase [Halomonas sp.]QHC49431.1 phosphate acetyltransferase [Halomonas tianxiuensis]